MKNSQMRNSQIFLLSILLIIGCQNKPKIESIKGGFLLNSGIFESFYQLNYKDYDVLKDSLRQELHSGFRKEIVEEEMKIFKTIERLELFFKPCKIFYTSDEDRLKRIYFEEHDFKELENTYWKQEEKLLDKSMIYEIKVIEIAPNIYDFVKLEKIEFIEIPVGEMEMEIEPVLIEADTVLEKEK